MALKKTKIEDNGEAIFDGAVIHTRGAIEYIVEQGKTGYLAPISDVDALADSLRLLMREPPAAQQAGLLGRARVTQEFSIEKEASGVQQVYDTVSLLD